VYVSFYSRPGCPDPAVFFVPGTGGRVEGFAILATNTDAGLRYRGRGIGVSSKPDDDIDELVDRYVQQIKTLQPLGPYFLLGLSFGGIVVYEMAQRLIETGSRVACLILLDTVTPKKFWPTSFWFANLWSRIGGHISRATSNPPKDTLAYYSRRLIRRWYGLDGIPENLKFGRDAAVCCFGK
jgi:surfactin synthase thioesterase subunit